MSIGYKNVMYIMDRQRERDFEFLVDLFGCRKGNENTSICGSLAIDRREFIGIVERLKERTFDYIYSLTVTDEDNNAATLVLNRDTCNKLKQKYTNI